MTALSKLFESLDETRNQSLTSMNKIKGEIQTVLNKRFDDWSALQKAIADSESASMYTWDVAGEVSTWFRFAELADVEEQEREYLEDYLQDHCIRVDWENDCLERPQGPCLIVNGDDEVLDQDSGKWIITKKDFANQEDRDFGAVRNELIEQWMEKSGYFPAVLLDNGHGDLTFVNTQSKKGK